MKETEQQRQPRGKHLDNSVALLLQQTGGKPADFLASCLQRHQLAGACKCVRTDVTKLLVSFQGSGKKGTRASKVVVIWRANHFFPPPPLPPPPVCVIGSQSVTHNLCILVPLKASLATSLMPFLVSRLSGGRGAKATNIKLLLPQSTRSVSILKRRFFHPFVLPAPRSEPFTLQRFDLKGSRRRVKPRRREELCVCVFRPSTISPAGRKLLFVETRLC